MASDRYGSARWAEAKDLRAEGVLTIPAAKVVSGDGDGEVPRAFLWGCEADPAELTAQSIESENSRSNEASCCAFFFFGTFAKSITTTTQFMVYYMCQDDFRLFNKSGKFADLRKGAKRDFLNPGGCRD